MDNPLSEEQLKQVHNYVQSVTAEITSPTVQLLAGGCMTYVADEFWKAFKRQDAAKMSYILQEILMDYSISSYVDVSEGGVAVALDFYGMDDFGDKRLDPTVFIAHLYMLLVRPIVDDRPQSLTIYHVRTQSTVRTGTTEQMSAAMDAVLDITSSCS